MSISPHIAIELFYDAAWQDITPDGMSRQNIQIRRGRSDEASQTDPASCRLQINNRDGRYSPRNPESPLYGKISRNTPIRIRLGTDNVRFVGEVVAWPQRWDSSGNDVWIPIDAAGILRRLGSLDSPLRSVLYRGIVASDPVAYWPLEDGEGSTQMASGLDDGEPMTIVRTPKLAAFDGLASSEPFPRLKDGQFVGRVGDYPYSQDELDWQLQFVAYLPDSEVLGTLLEVRTNDYVRRFVVETSPSGDMTLSAYGPVGDLLGSDETGSDFFTGRLARVTLTFHGNASDQDVRLEVLDIETGVASAALILLGHPAGHVTRVTLGDTALGDTAVGHVSLHNFAWLVPLEAQTNAYRGEAAARRIERLCNEEGIPLVIEGDPDATAAMGPQLPDTALNLLRECADADLGILGEQRDQIGLHYRTHESLYNRDPVVTLQYRGDLAPPLEPTSDDQLTANDVTVQRRGGSSARAIQQSGPLSVPEIGRYDASHTLSLHTDEQARQQAAWRLHLGTVDEPRYPVVTVDLEKNAHLAPSMSAVNAGDRIDVAGLPSWMPPGDASLTLQGTTETLNRNVWHWQANTSPASPYRVFELDSAELGRLATDGTQLHEGLIASSENYIEIEVTDGMLWTTDPADLPLDIVIGGEVMTVTDIQDPALTFEVARYGFESGELAPFTTSGDDGWFVSTLEHSGTYAVRSGYLADGSRSQLTLRTTAPDGGSVSFAVRMSSEADWDQLYFYIDGTLKETYSGIYDWTTTVKFPLGVGEHELTWVYRKDGSTSSGDDLARIDDVIIHGTVQEFIATRGVNGIDKDHPAGTPVQLHQPGVLALGQSGEDY